MTHRVWLTMPAAPLDRVLVEALQADSEIERVVCVYGSEHAANALPLTAATDKLQTVHADFSSYRSLRELLSSRALHDVDTIVHLLSAGGDGQSEHHRAPNAEATRHLLRLADEQPSLRRFVLRSYANLYRLDSREPVFIDENHGLELTRMPAGLRDSAEADWSACERLGGGRIELVILRCAELLAAGEYSPLYDYLSSRVCLRPLGYDPMLNVLSHNDLADAIVRAVRSSAVGIFNIPGYDTLPLSELIHATHRLDLPVPGPALNPLYALRKALTHWRFHYPTDETRFHYGAVLDGGKAQEQLGYVPAHPIDFSRLFE